MKKLLFFLSFLMIMVLMSGCAYQRYHAQNFKPDRKDNKVRDCRTYDDAFTMRDHYKKRNR